MIKWIKNLFKSKPEEIPYNYPVICEQLTIEIRNYFPEAEFYYDDVLTEKIKFSILGRNLITGTEMYFNKKDWRYGVKSILEYFLQDISLQRYDFIKEGIGKYKAELREKQIDSILED